MYVLCIIYMKSAQMIFLSYVIICVLQIELKLPVWYSFSNVMLSHLY